MLNIKRRKKSFNLQFVDGIEAHLIVDLKGTRLQNQQEFRANIG